MWVVALLVRVPFVLSVLLCDQVSEVCMRQVGSMTDDAAGYCVGVVYLFGWLDQVVRDI